MCLHQLISRDMYVVDERAIATAILARASAHAAVAAASFRSDPSWDGYARGGGAPWTSAEPTVRPISPG